MIRAVARDRAQPPALAADVDDWRELARCTQAGVNPDWWSEELLYGRGKHECLAHCPLSVRAKCNEEQEANPQEGVYAGRAWTRGARLRPTALSGTQPREQSCPECAARAVAA